MTPAPPPLTMTQEEWERFGRINGHSTPPGDVYVAALRFYQEVEAQAAALSALRATLEAQEKHDCERWRDEGLGCACCNPAAVASREAWANDPVRKERDALKATLEARDEEIGRLTKELGEATGAGVDLILALGIPKPMTANWPEVVKAAKAQTDRIAVLESALVTLRRYAPDGSDVRDIVEAALPALSVAKEPA